MYSGVWEIYILSCCRYLGDILLCLSVFEDIYFLVVLLVGLDKRHSLYRVHIGIPLRLFVWYCVCRYLN